MARRGENIYKRKDGRWEGRYMKGHRPDGKPIYGYIYAKKYSICKEKLIQAKANYTDEYHKLEESGSCLVSEFTKYWLHNFVKLYVKESTYSHYFSVSNKWIIPILGRKKLYKLDKKEIQDFIGVLSESGLSPSTVRNVYQVLFSALKKAKEYGYIKDNPCEGIKLPEIVKKEASLLTIQEQKKVEAVARESKYGFPILLAIYTGMRVGEICALKWEDVDLKNELINISQTTQRIQRFTAEAETKTILITRRAKSNNSYRVIPLPICIIELFKKHRKECSSEYVFTYNQHQLEPRVLQYRFKVLLKEAGVRNINFHALRHTFATRCLELNFDVKTLSEILGHSSAKMTLDRYGHSQIEHKRLAMSTLDQLYETTA